MQTLGRFGRLKQTLLTGEKKQTHIENKDISPCVNPQDIPSEPSENNSYVLEWLKICLIEGHIEPSQPSVGRLCGWPVRPFAVTSLYNDFTCWRIRNGASFQEVSDSTKFYSLVDRILPREGQKYFFLH